jgi:uncharacterized membrane protein YhaH (DUF805 family)
MSQTTNPFFLANRDAMNRYADFSGTTTRHSSGYFFLAQMVQHLSQQQLLVLVGNVLSIFFLIPSITAGVRRLHDVGKSGWFYLVPIYNIILLASPSKI